MSCIIGISIDTYTNICVSVLSALVLTLIPIFVLVSLLTHIKGVMIVLRSILVSVSRSRLVSESTTFIISMNISIERDTSVSIK